MATGGMACITKRERDANSDVLLHGEGRLGSFIGQINQTRYICGIPLRVPDKIEHQVCMLAWPAIITCVENTSSGGRSN